MGERDLRAFCRPPMGVPVAFAGVSTYPDGTPVYGNFDKSSVIGFGDGGTAGIESGRPELRLPFNAFSPMPQSGDTITVEDTDWVCDQPYDEDDGAFQVYALMRSG